MPYIKQERRLSLDMGAWPRDAGELNFKITMECWRYLQDEGISYHRLNEVIGALECCKQEFYRRMAVPYEDNKIQENGDVF